MKQDFVPYLPLILPQIFQLATLNPEMGIEGVSNSAGGLVDIMNEISSEKKEVNTEEIEEKEEAIEMLKVFLEELGGSFYAWIK